MSFTGIKQSGRIPLFFALVVLLMCFKNIQAQPVTNHWEVNVGGSLDEVTGFFTDAKSVIDIDYYGNVYFAASTSSSDGSMDTLKAKGGFDIIICKYDPAGNLLWSRSFGGSSDDIPRKIMCLDGGDFLLAGHTKSNSDDLTGHHGGDDGLKDGFITRFDSDGNVVWSRQYGGTVYIGSAGTGTDLIYSFIINSKGNIVAVGETNSQDGDLPADWLTTNPSFYVGWFLEVNPETGGVITSKKLKGINHNELNSNYTEDLVELSDGSGYAVLGNQAYFLSDFFWITKVDSAGEKLWEKEYGGNGAFTYVAGITETYDGNIMFTGSVGSGTGDVSGTLYNGGPSDMWLVKLDAADGTMMDQFCFGGTNSDIPLKILPDGSGKYYLAGYSNSTDGYMSGQDLLTDAYITYFTEDFDTAWTYKFGGSQYDFASDIVLGPNDILYAAGGTSSSDYFFDGKGYGELDGWVAKFTDPYTGVEKKELWSEGIQFYPNPTSGIILLRVDMAQFNSQEAQVRIYDGMGKIVWSESFRAQGIISRPLDLSTFQDGIYYVEIQSSSVKTGKQVLLQR